MENNFRHIRIASADCVRKNRKFFEPRQIIEEFVPRFTKSLKISNKKVMQPSEDRLSELTTKQIDRLIEMEKIKSLLKDNKKGINPIHINYSEKDGHHPNVYRPNFLAKINRIAVERNVRHLRSEEFDTEELSPHKLREKALQAQKKGLRFLKEYKSQKQKKKKPTFEETLEKSIDSIDYNLEEFESEIKDKKNQNAIRLNETVEKFKHKETNILSAKRWFDGMSTFYIEKPKDENEEKTCAYKSTIKSINGSIYSSVKKKNGRCYSASDNLKTSEKSTMAIDFQPKNNYLSVKGQRPKTGYPSFH